MPVRGDSDLRTVHVSSTTWNGVQTLKPLLVHLEMTIQGLYQLIFVLEQIVDARK